MTIENLSYSEFREKIIPILACVCEKRQPFVQPPPTAKILYFTNPAKNSDKVYKIYLNVYENSKYSVDFEYGRRGGTMQKGTKTDTPMGYKEAVAIFNNVVNEKINKGYHE